MPKILIFNALKLLNRDWTFFFTERECIDIIYCQYYPAIWDVISATSQNELENTPPSAICTPRPSGGVFSNTPLLSAVYYYNLHSDYSSDHAIIITQPRPLKISSTWEKRFDHLLEMGGRRFRVILFRRRTRVSIPCKEMIGVKRFLPVLIYRQISRDCILNQQPHWIVYHFLAGSLSSKI